MLDVRCSMLVDSSTNTPSESESESEYSFILLFIYFHMNDWYLSQHWRISNVCMHGICILNGRFRRWWWRMRWHGPSMLKYSNSRNTGEQKKIDDAIQMLNIYSFSNLALYTLLLSHIFINKFFFHIRVCTYIIITCIYSYSTTSCSVESSSSSLRLSWVKFNCMEMNKKIEKIRKSNRLLLFLSS